MPALKTFKGTSKQGNVQKALDAAIQAAQQAAPGADRQVIWKLKSVTGRQGGLVATNEATVAITVRFG